MIPNNNANDMMQVLNEKGFPVYIVNNQICAWPKRGNVKQKAMIISIPKSGTYFFAELLQTLGLEFTKIHVSENVFTDYRFASLEEARKHSGSLDVKLDLKYTVRLIKTGQFVVGHLPCQDSVKTLLNDFKKIIVYRDLRDVFVSHMRFLCATGRESKDTKSYRDLTDGPEKLLRHMKVYRHFLIGEAEKIIGWRHEKDSFVSSFEDLYGDNGKEKQLTLINNLSSFLNIPNKDLDCDNAIHAIIDTPTITSSGSRSKREIFWDSRVEAFFDEIGGSKINHNLGYQ